MSRRGRFAVVATMALLFGVKWCVADQAAEEAAIRKSAESFVSAFNAKDAKALAAHWLPEAIYVDPASGEKFVGRKAIEKHYGETLAAMKDAKLKVEVESVRFVSNHVAVESGISTLTQPNKTPDKSSYTAIHIKHGGQWLLDRVAEEDIPEVHSNYDKLKELEWLIGFWVDQDEVAVVETSFKWSKNRNFLIRTFAVTLGDRVSRSGVQVVGWDPTSKRIRSWLFDSDGGFGEGIWTKKGAAWHIHLKDTLADGQLASSTNIITKLNNDSFTWESVDRHSSGQLLPSIGPVKVVRKPTTE